MLGARAPRCSLADRHNSGHTRQPAFAFNIKKPPRAEGEITLEAGATPMPTSAAAARPLATATPTPVPWRPAPAKPLGELEGEGAWTPYIQISSGQTVAYRTFLQPDPKRP